MINQIFNEDCLMGMQRIPDKSVDMILCDLPYGTTNCSWDSVIPFDKLWEQYNRIIKVNGVVVLSGSEPFSSELRISNIKNYKYDWKWVKNKATGFLNAKIKPLNNYEDILVFYKDKITYNPIMSKAKKIYKRGYVKEREEAIYRAKNSYTQEDSGMRYPNRILEFSNNDTHNQLHPTQKPVKLFEYLIKTYTNENETVLDNCLGSGTTAIACINTKRNYIGFEMDKTYFDLASARIDKHTKEFNCEVGLFAVPTQKELF